MLYRITEYPWKVQMLEYVYYIKSCNQQLPVIGREGSRRATARTIEEHENNANLMAASPELLEALHDLLGCSELNMDDMET